MDNPLFLWIFGGLAVLAFGWNPVIEIIKKLGIKLGNGALDLTDLVGDSDENAPTPDQLKPTTGNGRITPMFALHFKDKPPIWLTTKEMAELQCDACEVSHPEDPPAELRGQK